VPVAFGETRKGEQLFRKYQVAGSSPAVGSTRTALQRGFSLAVVDATSPDGTGSGTKPLL